MYNGELGVICSIDLEEDEVTVNFEGREVVYRVGELDELQLAYATTIHKSQGSEYPACPQPSEDVPDSSVIRRRFPA